MEKKMESSEDVTTEDLTQVLEVINAEGDTGEIEQILEKNLNPSPKQKYIYPPTSS